MNSLFQFIQRLLTLLPPRFGQTLVVFGGVTMFGLSSFFYLVVAGDNIREPVAELASDRTSIVGLAILTLGASIYAFYAITTYVAEFALFFSIVVSWIEGVGAVTFVRRFTSWYYGTKAETTRSSSEATVFHRVADAADGYLRPRVIKYLSIIFVVLAANITMAYAVYVRLISEVVITEIILTIFIIQAVAGGIIGTIGITWKMRHTPSPLSPIVVGFVIAALGVNIFSFRTLPTELLNYLLSASTFLAGYIIAFFSIVVRSPR
jgi:hypothetical protein